ncbi:MAG: VWA domain-containing protein [Vicinamibacterales bacterium]
MRTAPAGRLVAAFVAASMLAAAAAPRVFAGGGTPTSPQAPQPTQGGTFRSGVDLVALNVTVTDPSNRYITGLGADDFQVFEDGVKQEVGYFSRASLFLSVSLLLDSSASMDDKMRTTQEAASGFVQTLRPEDQAQVIDFDSRVNVVAPFTSSKADLDKAIRSTVPGGSTSLFTAIYIALRELKKTEVRGVEDLRRRAVIVLSDGEDTSSLVSYDEVLELAKRSETAIYAIGIRSKETKGAGRASGQSDFALRQLTTQTGGRVFFPSSADELKSIYALISEELSSQYLVGYTSVNPKRDGAWRRIIVRVARPGATARTRMGYYAPGG